MAVRVLRFIAGVGRLLPLFSFLLPPLLLLLLSVGAGAQDSAQTLQPHRRFEYKYSFKGPHLVQSDGTVLFWMHTGNAIPSADQVRITPSLKSQRGSVWSKNVANFENWEIEVSFRVSGRGRIGADGLAIWFTTGQGLDGNVFGAADLWNGLGIFFDSFDNDGKKNNPTIVVVGNNGQLVYDHQNDGATQALASCQRDFRNKPYPVRAKITYYQRTLTVMINNGFTPNKDDYEFCAKVDNMVVPTHGYFGISAATGGLADDHDVLSFLTFQLTEPGKALPPQEIEIPKEEQDKYQEEFEHFQRELDKKKEDFQKEHPDMQEHPSDDFYESVNDRELRQIFEGQSRIHHEIKQLNRQLDMNLDEQKKYVADEIAKRGSGTLGQQGQVSQLELDALLKKQDEMLTYVNEIRNYVSENVRLSGGLENAGGIYETSQHFNDIKEHLHVVKRDIEHLSQRNMPHEKQNCPELPPFPSCMSTSHFFIFVAIQTVLFIGYIMYRSQQEAAAKKFF
ncbi:protein ERGIC-53 [Rhinatrema bivittatum]|uniref:protein ERGIC-53 n=1 Tax=Rhinatrema bivittatum TaxID=194408 RepID=UPI00112E894A|nr:protein ERGIC-53 [Rhinatrema bivittatum]XP_029435271.1 protein ERGIC-53 [Rhinatrema bivittatum]XP_029435279.1 protein ERGIC-53 [Rhinatrema bivittatum]XP_029435287.1 protein ERGIC-53 [Rhinatrema bivittatum]